MNVFVEKKQRGFVCLLLVVTVVFLFLFSVSLGWLHPPFLSRDARVFFFFFSSSFCTTTFSLRFPCCLCFFFSSRVYFCFLSSSSPPRLRSSFFFSLALHVCRQPRRFLFFSVFFFFCVLWLLISLFDGAAWVCLCGCAFVGRSKLFYACCCSSCDSVFFSVLRLSTGPMRRLPNFGSLYMSLFSPPFFCLCHT
jgi:hypothetical protein